MPMKLYAETKTRKFNESIAALSGSTSVMIISYHSPMLAHNDQEYQRLWLRRNRFRAIEILSRAIAADAEMIDCQKPTFWNIILSIASMVSSWCPRPWYD